jgi:aspartate/glutamate racemase
MAVKEFATRSPDMKPLAVKPILDTTLEITDRPFTKAGSKKVLLLATGETIRQKRYNSKLKQAGVHMYVPAPDDTANNKINDAIPLMSTRASCRSCIKTMESRYLRLALIMSKRRFC